MQAQAALLDDAVNAAIQALAVVCRDILGCQHNHVNVAPVGIGAHVAHEGKTVHFRHHQVQQDQSGFFARQLIERQAAVFGFRNRPALFGQQGRKSRARIGIVIDNQRGAGFALPEPAHDLLQPVPLHRLLQIIAGTKRIGQILLVQNRAHDDGNIGQLRLPFQRPQHRPAVHARHRDIQDNHMRAQRPCQFEAGAAIDGAFDAEPLLFKEARQQVPCCGIVIDDQHVQRGMRRLSKRLLVDAAAQGLLDFGMGLRGAFSHEFGRKADGENGAFALG